ncbi:MAG: hypothetical protein IH592_12055, partial [Bacteroidales bacterium]|nr:hypothetical protein [Bacteroidales bacterium]
MYDPVLGRFLSVDPVVQAPDNSQSLYAYSYCVNNPLKYSDPSGYALQTMKDLYYGVGSFYYRGGIYSIGEDGWDYYQPTLNGLMSRSSDISYRALNQDPFHEDSRIKRWFEPINFITAYLVGLDILGKSSGISNLPYLGKVGFFVQTVKSAYELNTGPHGTQAFNSGTDLAASAVGTFLGLGGFIGGVNYIIIDKTIGIENYALGFMESINLYG